MKQSVDFYFTLLSPWCYIGFETFLSLKEKFSLEVNYLPVSLPQHFQEVGWVPPKQRHPNRKAYRFYELSRWQEKRGLAFQFNPPFFPFDATLADCVVLALLGRGQGVEPFMRHVFESIWVKGENAADEDVLVRCIGKDAQAILEDAKSQEIITHYHENGRSGIERGIFGVPTFIWGGEIFFGQDRLDMLEEALASNRMPFIPKG